MTNNISIRSLAVALACGCLVPIAGCGDNIRADDGFEPWELEELTPEQGISLRVPQFEVAAGHESQNCYFVRVPDLADGQDLWINRITIAKNPGSHHLNVFRVKTIVNLDPADGTPIKLGNLDGVVIEGGDDYLTHPCWDSSNWADWPLIANSQDSDPTNPITEWQLPDKVATRLQPGEMLMIQTHYVNSTDQPTLYGARVGINLYRYDQPGDPIELGSLFATQQKIKVCQSNPRVTFSGTCRFPNDAVTITAANGHFHKRGKKFTIYPWDGKTADHPDESTMYYESDDWNHAPMAINLDVKVPANSGIWWDCNYEWRPPNVFSCDDVNAKDPDQTGDCCYTDGGITDVGEHCNVFLYYYPKSDTDVFCL
jgi:hypothetical protein